MADKMRLVEPTLVDEQWTIIHLPNGGILKSKHVVMGVMEILDEKGNHKQLEDGSLMYAITFSNPIVGYISKNENKITKSGLN